MSFDGGALPSPASTRDRLDFRVTGLPPCLEVDFELRLDGGNASQARFTASTSGTVSTATDAPSAGTWSGADIDGPFWSMRGGGSSAPASHDTTVVVRWDGGAPLSTLVRRELLPAGTTITPYREADGGLYADFYRPPGPGPFPGVVVFGGSEGGLGGGALTGSGLVRDGFAVLAMAYWAVPGKPATMTRIPLEGFRQAVQRLRAMPDVKPGKIALMGVSRGGEAALLAGAEYPADVQAVVAIVPSGYVWAAPGSSTQSTWTRGGGDVPFLPWPSGSNSTVTRDAGYSVTLSAPFFMRGLRDATDAGLAARAEIPVEQIAGPVMLWASGDDGIWPSCVLADAAWRRLTAAGHVAARGDRYTCFPTTGHSINPSRAGFPLWELIDRGTGSPRTGYGGSAKADNDADHLMWQQTVQFLADALR